MSGELAFTTNAEIRAELEAIIREKDTTKFRVLVNRCSIGTWRELQKHPKIGEREAARRALKGLRQ
jgi:hypothetical protein